MDEIKTLEEQVKVEVEATNEENQEQAQPLSELTLMTNPLYLESEDVEDMMETDEYKSGYKKGLELVGMYTALINSGVDAITANNILIYEHSNKWKLKHIEADIENKVRAKIEKELKGI